VVRQTWIEHALSYIMQGKANKDKAYFALLFYGYLW
jgi:hypothetical protein